MEEVIENIVDLSHLTPQAKTLAMLPDSERINRDTC